MTSVPVGSPSSGADPPGRRRSPRVVGMSVALMFAGAFALVQAELFLTGGISFDAWLLTYLGVQAGLLALVVLAGRLEHRPLREYGFVVRAPLLTSVMLATLLVLVFVTVELYPGILVGFGRIPAPTVLGFGFALCSAPLIAVGQEAVFRGYIFRTLTRAMPLTTAVVVSALLFAAQSTNFASLPSLGVVVGGEYLFLTTVTNLVLGLVLAYYYYKSRWSLVGPVAARTGLLWATTLMPVAAAFPNWEDAYAALVLAYGLLFAIVAVAIREPRLQAHQYLGEAIGPRRLRFRERARGRKELHGTVVAVGVLAVLFVATTQATPLVLGASPPVLAIATGSMVPTLDRGTLVVLEHASPSAIAVGTIIAFHVSCLPAPTVHRVYRILQGGSSPVYQTKGDANPSPDPCSVPYADVIGRVVAIVPFLGLLALDPVLDAAIVALVLVVALIVPRRGR